MGGRAVLVIFIVSRWGGGYPSTRGGIVVLGIVRDSKLSASHPLLCFYRINGGSFLIAALIKLTHLCREEVGWPLEAILCKLRRVATKLEGYNPYISTYNPK